MYPVCSSTAWCAADCRCRLLSHWQRTRLLGNNPCLGLKPSASTGQITCHAILRACEAVVWSCASLTGCAACFPWSSPLSLPVPLRSNAPTSPSPSTPRLVLQHACTKCSSSSAQVRTELHQAGNTLFGEGRWAIDEPANLGVEGACALLSLDLANALLQTTSSRTPVTPCPSTSSILSAMISARSSPSTAATRHGCSVQHRISDCPVDRLPDPGRHRKLPLTVGMDCQRQVHRRACLSVLGYRPLRSCP